MEVAGEPLLHHVVHRTSKAKRLDAVVVATSETPGDDPIVDFCEARGISCFRGSEHDVLDRYHQSAKLFGARVVARVTADCPLIDPDVIDRAASIYAGGEADYVSNTIECTYPDGLDIEVFSYDALELAWRNANLQSEREHVTPYIKKHPELFRLQNIKYVEDLSALRWTVDEPGDLEYIRAIYGYLGSSDFDMNDVLVVLRRHPELADLNRGIARNEGYVRSVREDKVVKTTLA